TSRGRNKRRSWSGARTDRSSIAPSRPTNGWRIWKRAGERRSAIYARFWNFRTRAKKSSSVSRLFSRIGSAMGSSPAYRSSRNTPISRQTRRPAVTKQRSSFQPPTQAPPRVPVPTVKRVDHILQNRFFLAAAHGLAQAVPAAKTFVGAEEGESEKEGHEIIDDPEQHERS